MTGRGQTEGHAGQRRRTKGSAKGRTKRPPEPVRLVTSNAVAQFGHLAKVAPTEAARQFWRRMAHQAAREIRK